jgi:hypothetical protein
LGVVGAAVAGSLWVPETRRTSCDLLVLVKQAAEAVEPLDADDVDPRSCGQWPQGCSLVE